MDGGEKSIELLPGSDIRDAFFNGIIYSYDNNCEISIISQHHWCAKIGLQDNKTENDFPNAASILIKFYSAREEDSVEIKRIIDLFEDYIKNGENNNSCIDYPNIDYIWNICVFHNINISYEGLYSDHFNQEEG
jgi:hypothetical protein